MIILPSARAPRETMDRLAAAVAARGMEIFARIDHAAGAAAAGLALAPTEVLIFGAARAGTPLMQAAPTTAIDLPLKALVWRDGEGRVWLGYNRPDWIAARHGVAGLAAPLAKMTEALDAVAREAVSPA